MIYERIFISIFKFCSLIVILYLTFIFYIMFMFLVQANQFPNLTTSAKLLLHQIIWHIRFCVGSACTVHCSLAVGEWEVKCTNPKFPCVVFRHPPLKVNIINENNLWELVWLIFPMNHFKCDWNRFLKWYLDYSCRPLYIYL